MNEREAFFRSILVPTREIVSQPVPIVPFKNWDYYYITQDLEWRVEKGSSSNVKEVKVPRGFVTDLASIPTPLWSLLPPAGPYSYPAIIHDFLYWFQPCERADADTVLRLAMEDAGVPPLKVEAIYRGVDLGGEPAWEANKKARSSGENRILSQFPSSIKITWAEWKQDPKNFQSNI